MLNSLQIYDTQKKLEENISAVAQKVMSVNNR